MKKDLTASHAAGCVLFGPKGNQNSYLHEVFRNNVLAMLKFSHVGVDPTDLTHHKGVNRRLKAVGAIPADSRPGLFKGADMLATNIMADPGQLANFEMALDPTVTAKWGSVENPLDVLAHEEAKKKERYGDLYDTIDIDTYGLAMNAWGVLGPNLLKLIEKCDEYRGLGWADHLPPWTTWRCSTFVRAWQTRFIVSMQIAAASKINFAAAVVARVRSRVADGDDVGS